MVGPKKTLVETEIGYLMGGEWKFLTALILKKIFSLKTELNLKYTLNKKLLFFTHTFMFLVCFHGSETFSEIKKEIIRFSSETAHIKKKDGLLYLSGDVKISYREYLIKSDFLIAKTNDIVSKEIKVIEAEKNIYFSNNKDIIAKGDKLILDIEKICFNRGKC